MNFLVILLPLAVFVQPVPPSTPDVGHSFLKSILSDHEVVVLHSSYAGSADLSSKIPDSFGEQVWHRDSRGALWIVARTWHNPSRLSVSRLRELPPDRVVRLCTSHPRYGGAGVALFERNDRGDPQLRVENLPLEDADASISLDVAGWVNPIMGHALAAFGYLHADPFDVGRLAEFQPVAVKDLQLESTGSYGDYSVVFADVARRTIRKARVVKLTDHVRFGTTLRKASERMMAESGQQLPMPRQMTWELECQEWVLVNGMQAPARFTRTFEFISDQGELDESRIEVSLSYRPTTTASYDFEVPEGTRFVGRLEDGGILYEWRDGKRVPVAHAPTVSAIEDAVRSADVTEARERAGDSTRRMWVMVGTIAFLFFAGVFILAAVKLRAARARGH